VVNTTDVELQRKYQCHISYHIGVLIAMSTNMMPTVSIGYTYQHRGRLRACVRACVHAYAHVSYMLPCCGN